MEMKHKIYSVETKTVDDEAGIYEALISTEAVDRDGDIVVADGADIKNYMKNPVVLWAHDYRSLPVAKALKIEVMERIGIKATFQFPEPGTSEQADAVRKLWAGGFLNATSIGFIPKEWEEREGDEDADDYLYPRKINTWELLEFSIVPVPANQEALRLGAKLMGMKLQGKDNIPFWDKWGGTAETSIPKDAKLEITYNSDTTEPEPEAEPNTDDDTERRSEAEDDGLVTQISEYINALNEHFRSV